MSVNESSIGMPATFKPDLKHAQENWERFWRGENVRPVIFCEIAKCGYDPVRKPGPAAGATGDYDSVIDQALQ